MKYEINIEIERTTIIGNYSPKPSEIEKDDNAIKVEAKEIKTKVLGLLPKSPGKNNNENKL
jgi:hypothetical protein